MNSKDSSDIDALALSSVAPNSYDGIDHDRLVAYVVKLLADANVRGTFENITVAAYRLFPRTFCLSGYPQYPDAARVNRTLLHGGPKYRDYLVGRATTGYALSPRGLTAASETAEMLAGAGTATRHRGRAKAPRIFQERMEREIRQSDAYKSWESTGEVSTEEFFIFLHLLPNSPKAAVRENLTATKDGLVDSTDSKIAAFMTFIAATFKGEIG